LADDFDLLINPDIWLTLTDGFFRPVTILFIKTFYLFFGTNPLPYHLASFILHFLTGILLYLLVIGITKNSYLALMSQLLFGVHYLSSEAVFWISAINSVLATFFCLSSILMYFKYRLTGKKAFLYLSLVGLCLALLSKEEAVTIPIFIILTDMGISLYKAGTFKWRDTLKRTLPLYLVGLVYLVAKAYSISTAFNQHTLQIGYHAFRNLRYMVLSLFTFDTFNDLPLLKIDIALLNLFKNPPIPSLVLKKIDLIHFYLPLLTGLLILALVVFLLVKGEKRTRLALLACLIAGGPVIFFSGWHIPYGGYFQYPLRLYYLPAALFFIFLACFFQDLLKWGQKKIQFKRLIISLVILFSISIGISDFIKLKQRGMDWRQAGKLAHSLLVQLEPYLKQPPQDKTIVLLNLADNYNGAYIYRNGIQAAVKIFYPQSTATIEVRKNPDLTEMAPRVLMGDVVVLDCSEEKIKLLSLTPMHRPRSHF